MTGAPIYDIFHFILALGLAMARIFPSVLLTPVFSFDVVKGVTRSAIVVALSLFMAPVIKPQLDILRPDMWVFVGLALKELIIGALIGFLLGMPFWMYESIGVLFDNQRGALMGGQINPQLGPDDTPIGNLMLKSAILLLFVGLGISTITQIFWDSYTLWPAVEWMPFPSESGFKVYLDVLAGIFKDMVLFAGPLVALMMMVDFAIGIISIYSQQLQATILTIPIKCLLGLIFLVLYIPLLDYVAGERLYQLRDMIHILPNILETKGGTP